MTNEITAQSGHMLTSLKQSNALVALAWRSCELGRLVRDYEPAQAEFIIDGLIERLQALKQEI